MHANLEHAACPLLLEALEERSDQVIDIEQLIFGFHQRLQDLRQKPATSQAQSLTIIQSTTGQLAAVTQLPYFYIKWYFFADAERGFMGNYYTPRRLFLTI